MVWKKKKNSAGTFFVPFAAIATFGGKMSFAAGGVAVFRRAFPELSTSAGCPC